MLTSALDEQLSHLRRNLFSDHERGFSNRFMKVPFHILSRNPYLNSIRYYSTTSTRAYESSEEQSKTQNKESSPAEQKELTHLTKSGDAHMVSISTKQPTARSAVAVCSVRFSNGVALPLVRDNRAKKGDVLGVARIAGIMAAKKTSDLIPLCHPIAITHVTVELEISDENEKIGVPFSSADKASMLWLGTDSGGPQILSGQEQPKAFGTVNIRATVSCEGKTGVEMEALTAASTAALTVYDMCKAVDKGMRIEGLRVVRKEGGKSGTWVEGIADGQE
jgi:molybdenum cofactor biosynthesis protein MoaC